MQLVRIEANVPWEYRHDDASGYWLAICDPLKLTVQAERFSELSEVISGTLSAVFSDLLESGDLKAFLREHGWHAATPIPQHSERTPQFDIPWELVQAANDSQRRLHQ